MKAKESREQRLSKSYRDVQNKYNKKAEKHIKTAERLDRFCANILQEKEEELAKRLSRTKRAESRMVSRLRELSENHA